MPLEPSSKIAAQVGRNIQGARQLAGYEQHEVAFLLWGKKSRQGDVSKIETGRKPVKVELLVQVAAVLGVRVASLLDGCDGLLDGLPEKTRAMLARAMNNDGDRYHE